MRLNPAQDAAVRHRGSPLLVLAGAGTGKTRVITHRVAALLAEGVPAWRILAVTFTNKAAAEMRERIAGLCEGRDDLRELWVGTFHAICARILRRWGEPVGLSRNFSILDTSDQLSVMKRVIKEQNVDPRVCTPQTILGYLDKAKNRGHQAEGIARNLQIGEPLGSIVEAAARAYQRQLRAGDAADFGDLLVLAVRLLEGAGGWPTRPPPPPPPQPAAPQLHGPLAAELGALAGELTRARPAGGPGDNQLGLAFDALRQRMGGHVVDGDDPVLRLRRRFTHIVVDEYQDTNPVQAMLIDLLGERAELCVVGDDDQSIYGWRGAEVDLILRFPERHPGAEVVRLEQNYRSTGHILGCANAIIRRNLGRFGKQLFSDLGDGDKVMVVPTHDEVDEARLVVQRIESDIDKGVPPTEIAVFYRTHAQSRVLEDALHRAGVRYTIYGGLRFFDRKEIKDLLAYLRLLLNPASDVDLQRIINVPARGIGNTTVERLTQHASERGLTLSEALDEAPAIGLGAAACRKLSAFQGLLAGLREAMADQDLGELATTILEVTGYRAMLAADGTDESRDRLENLQEFVGALEAFTEDDPEATLADYLEQVALVADADGDGESLAAVTLMTIHSAKGLEFQSVYLTGMEERVFPHARVIEDPAQMEEERRLAYVAVTRAKRHLTITWARQRRLYGQLQLGEPSRFIRELPPPHVLGPNHGASMAQRGPAPARPAREPSWDSDIVYDEPSAPRPRARAAAAAAAADDDAIALYVGMRVRHGRYGEGELIAWDGAGQNLKLTLHFPGVGTKTILARYCEPA